MGSQEILKQYNAVKNQYDAVNYDEILKAQLEKDASNLKADIDTFSSGYDTQINNTRAIYDKNLADAKTAYESEYQKNAVQKLINEKKIAETNANLGLTDSGLNRTQQTAAQLSYSNQKGKIDLARQSALDNLTLAMTDAITTLQNEKASGIRDIENNWKSYSEQQAQNTYNTKLSSYADQLNNLGEQYSNIAQAEIDAAADIQKAQISASAKALTVSYGAGGTQNNNYILRTKDGLLSRDYYGTLKENGVDTVYNYDENGNVFSVTYTDNNSGKQTTIAYGKNPYTGEDNINGNSDAAKAVKKYGAYGNGYQPKGVYINGTDYGKMVGTVGKTDPEDTDGIAFNVFETKTDKTGVHRWVWDATINNYAEVVKIDGEWKFKEE